METSVLESPKLKTVCLTKFLYGALKRKLLDRFPPNLQHTFSTKPVDAREGFLKHLEKQSPFWPNNSKNMFLFIFINAIVQVSFTYLCY